MLFNLKRFKCSDWNHCNSWLLLYHFVFQCSFKFKAPLTGTPPINDNHSIAQRGQRVQTEVLHPFEGVVHQLHLNTHIHTNFALNVFFLFIYTLPPIHQYQGEPIRWRGGWIIGKVGWVFLRKAVGSIIMHRTGFLLTVFCYNWNACCLIHPS